MTGRISLILTLTTVAAFAQDAGALQQRVGELKVSIAQNQAQLRQYTWTETVLISLKGEEKKRNQNACVYGPDGKIQKTPIGAAPAAPEKRRGLKGKIVANKVDDLKEYMDRVQGLLQRYIPPDPQTMQTSLQSGKATLNPGLGAVVFSDYVKPGDKVTIVFDRVAKKIKSFSVATYLDKPGEAVTMDASFTSLPDGTNYLADSVLDATADKIRIKTTNSGHRKAGG